MKRWAVLLVLMFLGLWATEGGGSPIQKIKPVHGKERETVGSYNSRLYTFTFRGAERSVVIVSGDGSSYLGLYVYDQHGNCVAKDDLSGFPTRDDLAVEWYPHETAPYTIEVKNLGRSFNTYEMAIR
jgi:hypothetical protein